MRQEGRQSDGLGNCISLTHRRRPHPVLAECSRGKSGAKNDRFVIARRAAGSNPVQRMGQFSVWRPPFYARAMSIPEPMLSTRAATWPAQRGWVMEPKWDGFRLLVAIDQHGVVRAWSRRGASLGDRLGALLDPLADAPRGTVVDGELVALSFGGWPGCPGFHGGVSSGAPG
jgi:ATP-dependent DNA ligase